MAILRKGREYRLWIISDRTSADYNLANQISGILEYKWLYSPKSNIDVSLMHKFNIDPDALTPLGVNDIEIAVGYKQNFIACSVMPYRTIWLSRKSFWPLDVKALYVWVEDPRSPFM